MSLLPGEDIGPETPRACDQFFRIEKGWGKCVIDDSEREVRGGDAVVVPVGAKHNIINLSPTEDLKLYTIYSPPNHKDATVRATKLDAQNQPEKYDGATTEYFSDEYHDSKKVFDERNGKIEFKIFGESHTVKLNRREKKLAKEAEKIVKHEHKIDDLKEKMAKLNHEQTV